MILAAGLTPAWQQIAIVDSLGVGDVNRARRFVATASGKVINVGIALHSLDAPGRTLSFLGGVNGRAIREEFAASDIPARWVETATPTRVCTTILDDSNSGATELVENAAPVTEDELMAFLTAFAEEALQADSIVVSGSLPEGTPPDFHSRLLQSAAESGARFILDISGPALLRALEERPFLVKPNREELARSLGRDLSANADLRKAMTEMIDRGANWCVVTDGPAATHATDGSRFFEFQPPGNVPVVNPIGCGDCFAAGLAFGLDANRPMTDAVRLGIAAAAENLRQLLPARLDRRAVEQLAAKVERRES